MAARTRNLILGLLTLVPMGLTGCNPSALYFLLMGVDSKVPPACPLVIEDKPKEPAKVLVLIYADPISEIPGAEQQLFSSFAKHLMDGSRANQKKIDVVSSTRLKKFKDDHPNWHTMDLPEIGKKFDADFVVSL